MVLNLRNKQSIIAEISKMAKSALSAVVANFNNVPVNKMTALRKAGCKAGVDIRVIRNTLIRRAIQDTAFSCLKDIFVGPTLIAFSNEHPGAAARLFKAFSKENINFEIKAAAFKGKFIPASQIDYLVMLPTYEEAIYLLISTIKEVSTGKLIRTLAALCDQKKLV